MKITKFLRILIATAVSALALTVISLILYEFLGYDVFYTLFITFLTVFYHFAMRISVGFIVNKTCKNRKFRYGCFHYKQHRFEPKLYEFLRVSRWKKGIPTANPDQFDVSKRTFDQLLHNITQAELVHEWIILLSFLPIALIIPFGTPSAFIITSVLSAILDSVFVIVQRYNRPLLLKIEKRYRRYHG